MPTPAGISYAAEIEPLLVAKCSMGCHTPGGFGGTPEGSSAMAALDLSLGAGYAALTTGTSLQVDLPLVGDTLEGSYLWLKLTGEQTVGTAMPLGVALPPMDMDKIRAWIEGGAQP